MLTRDPRTCRHPAGGYSCCAYCACMPSMWIKLRRAAGTVAAKQPPCPVPSSCARCQQATGQVPKSCARTFLQHAVPKGAVCARMHICLTWGLPSTATCGPVALGVPLLLPAPMPVLVGLVGGLHCCCLLPDESRTPAASEVLLRTSFTRKITVTGVAAVAGTT